MPFAKDLRGERFGSDNKVYSGHVLKSVLHSTPVHHTFSGTRHGAGTRDKENLLSGSSQSRGTRRAHCHCVPTSTQGIGAQRCSQASKGEKLERCQTHLGLEVSLKSREDHGAGEGVDGDAWQQEWPRKVLRCVEGPTPSRTAIGKAHTQLMKSFAHFDEFNLRHVVT